MRRNTIFELVLSLLKVIVGINKNKHIKKVKPLTPTEKNKQVGKDIDFTSVSSPSPKVTWHDLTLLPRTKERGEAQGTRDWKKVTGITLHQTAVQFGDRPKRLLNVPVHGATLPGGDIVLLHDPTDYMWHAGRLNRTDVGIEVSCRATGLEEQAKTLWLPKKDKHLKGEERLALESPATDKQIESTKKLVRYYVDLVSKNGGKIKYIHAHRQSSKSRRSDPGERVWREVGEWAKQELGLSDGGPGWTKGGIPLPDEWTGESNGIKY